MVQTRSRMIKKVGSSVLGAQDKQDPNRWAGEIKECKCNYEAK